MEIFLIWISGFSGGFLLASFILKKNKAVRDLVGVVFK